MCWSPPWACRYLKTMRVDRMTRETHVHRAANGRCRGEIREQSGKITFCTLKFRSNSQQKRCWRNLRSVFWQQDLSGLNMSWQIPCCFWNPEVWQPLEQILPPSPQFGQCPGRPGAQAELTGFAPHEASGPPVLGDSCWPGLKCNFPVILSRTGNVSRSGNSSLQESAWEKVRLCLLQSLTETRNPTPTVSGHTLVIQRHFCS